MTVEQRAMKLLEGLTPGGSEFFENPENCEAYIRRRLESQHRMILRLKVDRYPLNGEPRSEQGELEAKETKP